MKSQVKRLTNLFTWQNIEYITDDSIISKKAKANFKTLGKKLGKDIKAAADIIGNFDQAAIAQLEKTNSYAITINGTGYDLALEDVEIMTQDIPGWALASDTA
jgi:isoleucyl-tRNA synthetase